jgi:NAD(P)-dependent dehydrogenase (short-subunit alcohol dehydrogenase family)
MRATTGMSVVITGGGSGIGAATARHFAARGALVTICGRRTDKIDTVARDIGANCVAVTADVTNAADRIHLIETALRHGGGIDALISNAGNMYRAPLTELDEAQLLALFHTNVIAGMLLSGLATPLLEARRGAIVFIGSVHTRRAFPGASPYAATKGAIEVLTRVLAAELGPKHIRVNCVVPGAVLTEINQRAGLYDDAAAAARLTAMAPLHALGRIGTGDEIAEAIEYLVCAQWTTGAVLEVDGGLGLGLTNA